MTGAAAVTAMETAVTAMETAVTAMETAVTDMETAEKEEMNHNSAEIHSTDAEATDIEFQILSAIRSSATYLRDKVDAFTFESVRRLLEEKMGLEKYALDVHKSFVKEHLIQCVEDAGNDGASENFQETDTKDDASPIKELEKPSEGHKAENGVREETDDDEKMKGSPESRTSKTEAGVTKDDREALMSDISEALRKRTSYIKANSEEITMASLRRLLEQDLKLKKHSLDPFKKFINNELDEVLQIPDAPKHSPIGKNLKKKVKSTPSRKVGSVGNSDSATEEDVDNEEVAVKKTMTQKRKLSKSEITGKQKCEIGKPVSVKKKPKHTETDSENDSDAGDSEMKADNGHSQKPLKQVKEISTPVYGKRVEHLKSVIKSCGMSVPPVIYRKVKQAPEEKREATLIEELEHILAKEGLSSDPSEKEIKEVKKKKVISKELEGIDTSNIVSSSRRRSTTRFVPPPKPIITSESESDEPEESENGEDNEEEEDEGNEEAEEGTQSEEESNNEDDCGEESE